MRPLLPALIAAGLRAPPRTPPAPTALVPRKLPLEPEELEACAGIWRVALNLDDGEKVITVHLDGRGGLSTTDAQGLNVCSGEHGWSSTRWQMYARPESPNVSLRLQIGILYLEGKGTRQGLRCKTLKGSVLEGAADPCCVGSFKMSLVLPLKGEEELSSLEALHSRRVKQRPAPPLSFSALGFVGKWRLLLSMDSNQAGGDSPPAYFCIRLKSDRTFESEGSQQRLAGTWGVFGASSEYGGVRGSFIQKQGSGFWLEVKRDRCSETLRGIADLPLRENFALWGKPVLGLEAELRARLGPGGTATADRVDGRMCCGDVERVFFGRFSLLRDEADGVQA